MKNINTKAPSRFSTILFILILTIFCAAGISAQDMKKGGGGTPTPTPTPNPLPQTAPAAGVLYRESFGEADLYRPNGGKGTMKTTYVHTNLKGFWIEYPGSKDTQWMGSEVGQSWNLCAASDNPYEMYSPIQMTLGYYGNGCVISDWFDDPTVNPTALMPVSLPSTPYEVSFNGYPAPISGKYLALGLTDSSVLYSNLETSGNVVLVIRQAEPFSSYTIQYELRAGGMNGTLLASGETYFEGWNQLKLVVDPINHTVGGSVNGSDLGVHSLDIGRPRYAGFEGVAVGDNFVIRTL